MSLRRPTADKNRRTVFGYSTRRDHYLATERAAYQETKRRSKLWNPSVDEKQPEPPADREYNPFWYNASEMPSKVPVSPELEQCVSHSGQDAIEGLAIKATHKDLQGVPGIQYVPIHVAADNKLMGHGSHTSQSGVCNLFIGQTPDVYAEQQVALIQQLMTLYVAPEATMSGLRTVRPHGNRPRHFHTFNVKYEFYQSVLKFFDVSTLMEPGGAWLSITEDGKKYLQNFIAEYKARQIKNAATPTNLLVMEKTGEMKESSKKAKAQAQAQREAANREREAQAQAQQAQSSPQPGQYAPMQVMATTALNPTASVWSPNGMMGFAMGQPTIVRSGDMSGPGSPGMSGMAGFHSKTA